MRSVVLDSFRGIAVILVLFRHYYFSEIMRQVGWIGVDLFFVLSGFLVSGLLFKQHIYDQRVDAVNFLIRRGFKIYPLFYLFLALTVAGHFILSMVNRSEILDLNRMPYELFFVQNYFKGVWIHTWSLAVEEHFYLLLAIIVTLLCARNILQQQKIVIRGILFILLIILILRVVNFQINPHFLFRTHLFPTHLRIDSLFFGVLLSYLQYYHPQYFEDFMKKHWRKALVISGTILITPFIFTVDSQFMGTIGLSLLYVSFGLLLWIAVCFETQIVASKPYRKILQLLSYIGFFSYSIYLFHIMVAIFLMPLVVKLLPFEIPKKLLFLIYCCLCVGAGSLVSILIEQPVLRLRDRLFPRSKPIKV